MRQFNLIAIIISLFFINSCSNDNITSPTDENKGAIQLKIDKANAPSNVSSVKAYLSRDGFDQLVGFLDLISDTTADITFNAIPVGKWHLIVDALDSLNNVIYTGETEVDILANFYTQVHLTLNPTGDGTGSIYIHVTWGTSNGWKDFLQNPILSPLNNNYDFHGIIQSYIFHDDGKYIMHYAGVVNSGRKYVLKAESQDGIFWTRTKTTPILYPGDSWDSLAVHPGPIVKENGHYRMYFSGFADQYGKWSIGLAISNNGTDWIKFPGPIIEGSDSGWEYQIIPWSIIKKNNKYYMYYAGRGNYPEISIGVAISSDGLSWEKYQANPIITPTLSWENNGIFQPSVIYDDGIFKMAYANISSDAFGWATSSDGLNWEKSSTPFFTTDKTVNNWSDEISYPMLIKIGSELRCYYTGFKYNSLSYTSKIGFASK
jgi:predicted GH43/DUF377 family glycosyl hydrolase